MAKEILTAVAIMWGLVLLGIGTGFNVLKIQSE